jgi:formylmethanofuran dehydrogenase subunit E
MPRRGVPARVEVLPEFASALLHLTASTHVVVIGWLHRADRGRLQVQRPAYGQNMNPRGVFACRSPERPNPLGITTARVLRLDGTNLYLDLLDMIDGTPVIDLKPHAHGLDSAFSARSARELARPGRLSRERTLEALLHEAERFHGERCLGVALGARAVYHWMVSLDVGQKDPGTIVWLGSDGCLADALQALTGATFGNGRLRVGLPRGEAFCLERGGRAMRFAPRRQPPLSSEEQVLAHPVEELFELQLV